MNKPYPLTTVLVSSYNRPRLIRDALDSVLAQTWQNVECIVADDWSNGEVRELLNQYHDKFDYRGQRFKVIKPIDEPTAYERQYGQRCSVCINEAMKYVCGEFICYLPDDDMFAPRSIEIRAQCLINQPEVNAVYGRLEACHVEAGFWPGVHAMSDDGRGSEFYFGIDMPEGYRKPTHRACRHDRDGFWSAKPITRAANRVDHSMMMVRRVPNLPKWPEVRTQEWFHVCACAHITQWHDTIVSPQETGLGEPPWSYEPWASSPQGMRTAFCYSNGEQFDCPDAGFFFRLELAGLGPFYSVDEVAAVKRYGHPYGHRTDPSRRE